MLEKLLENRPSVATLRRKARLPEQKCCELKFLKLNLVIICRWADTLWALGGHKEKDWFGLAARRVVRSGELVGDLQGGRGRRKKAKKKLRHSARPTKLPLYRARPNSQPFCAEWSFLLGRHYSLRQKGAPKDRFVLCRADAVVFWGIHLTHVVFTFCSAVQFLWTRLSLERGTRILILPSDSLVTWEGEKKDEKGEKNSASCNLASLFVGLVAWLYLQDCWAQLKSLLTICSNSGYQKNTKTD